MKLHLPSGLRKALLACIAAISAHSLPVTVATGAAYATSGALVSYLLGQQALADDADDDDVIMPLALGTGYDYKQGEYSNGADLQINGNTEFTISGGSGEQNLTFTVSDESAHLKITFGDAGAYFFRGVNVSSLWVTSTASTSAGLLFTDDESDLSHIDDIYVDKAQFWFRKGNTYDNLKATFHLGTSVRDEGNYSGALRFNAAMTTTGGLEVLEDTTVVFQNNVAATFGSALRGSGNLTLRGATGMAGTTTLSSGGNLDGTLTVHQSTLNANGDLTVTGLTLTANSVLNVGSGKTLTVNEDTSITGTLNLKSGGADNAIANFVANGNFSADLVVLYGGSLKLKSGGSISNLAIDGWGTQSSSIVIGGDLEIGALSQNGSGNPNFGSGTNLRNYSITRLEGTSDDVYVLFNDLGVFSTFLGKLVNEGAGFTLGEGVGHGLNITGENSFAAAQNLTGNFKLFGGGMLALGESTVDLTSLVLADNSGMSFGNALTIGDLSGNGIFKLLSLEDDLITITGSASGELILDLSGLADDAISEGTYNIFAELSDWSELNVTLAGVSRLYDFSFTDGVLTISEKQTEIGSDLTFEGSDTTFEWGSAGSDVWTDGGSHVDDAWINDSNAIFAGTAEGVVTVNLVSEVRVDNLTVQKGSYDITGEYTLSIAGNLNIEEGSSLAITGSSLSLTGELNGSGSLTLTGLTLDMNSGDFSGDLTINDGATVNFNGASYSRALTSAITVNGSGVLYVNGATELGTLSGNGAVRLKSDKNNSWNLLMAGGTIGEIQVQHNNGGGIVLTLQGSLTARDLRLTNENGGNSGSGWSDTDRFILEDGVDLTLTAATFGGYNAQRTIFIDASEGEHTFTVTPNSGGNGYAILRGSLHTASGVTFVKQGNASLALGCDNANGEGSTISYHLIEGDMQIEGGTLSINSAARIKGDVSVAFGATLRFWKGYAGGDWGNTTKERVIEGVLSGEGTLRFINELVLLQKGGTIGNLISGWANSVLSLGDDLTVNSNVGVDGGSADIVIRRWDGAEADTVTLYMNLGSGNYTLNNRYYFEDGVVLGKKGEGNLQIASASNSKILGGILVEGGTVTFTDAANLDGAITIDGGKIAFNATGNQIGDLILNAVSGSVQKIEKGITINGDVEIAAGQALQFSSGDSDDWTIKGEVSGEGTLYVYDKQLTLERGGTVGMLANAWNDSTIVLGDDLVIQGASKSADNYKKSNGSFSAMDGKQASLVFDTTKNDIDIHDFEWQYDGIGLGVKGGNTLTMNAGTFTTISVAGGSTLALSDDLGAGSLTFSNGGTVSLDDLTLTVSSISGDGTITLTDGGALSGVTDVSDNLSISISGVSLETLTSTGYELFTGSPENIDDWWDLLTITFEDIDDFGNYDVIHEGGIVKLEESDDVSVWHWVSGDGIWTEDETLDWARTKGGTPEFAYDYNYDKFVVFDENDATAEKPETITLNGVIAIAGVTVHGNYRFDIGDGDGLSIMEDLTVSKGASLVLHNDEGSSGSVAIFGDIKLSGMLTIEGFTDATIQGDLSVEADAELTLLSGQVLTVENFSLNGNKLTVTGDGSITTHSAATVTLTDGILSLGEDGVAGSSFAWNDQLILAGGQLEVRGNSIVTGNIDMSNGSGISLYDNATITSVSGAGDILVGSGENTATLTDGGKIDGALKFNEWGGTLKLGNDLEISTFSAENNLTSDRTRTITADSDVTLTTTGTMAANVAANKITTGEHVTLNVSEGRLNFNNSTFGGNVIVGENAILKVDSSNFNGKSVELKEGSVFAPYASSIAAVLSGDGALMAVGAVTLTGGGSVGTLASGAWNGMNLTIDGCDFTFTNVARGESNYVLSAGAATGNISLANGGTLKMNETNWGNVEASQVTLNISGAESGGTVEVEATTDWELGTPAKMNITKTNLELDKTGEGKLTVGHETLSGWKSVAVSEGTLAITGGEATINDLTLNGTLSLADGASVAGLTSLTLGDAATLAVSSLSEDDARISGTGTLSGALTLDINAWEDLETLLGGSEDVYTFALFSGFTQDSDFDFSIADWDREGWEYELTSDGDLVFRNVAEIPDTLYWATNTDGIWMADDSKDWAANDGEQASFKFATGRDVVFGAQGASKTVSVVGEVTVKNMTVSAAGYSFNAGTDGSITVNGDLTFSVNNGVILSVDTTVKGNLVHNTTGGTVTLQGGHTLTIGGDLKITASGAAFAFGNGGGTVTIDGVLNGITGSWLSLNNSFTITIKGADDSHVGTMNGAAEGAFNLAGNLTIEDLRQGGSVTFNRYEESTNDTVTVTINGYGATNVNSKNMTFTDDVNVVFASGLVNDGTAYTGTLKVTEDATFTKKDNANYAINLGTRVENGTTYIGTIDVGGTLSVTGKVKSNGGIISAGTLSAADSTIELSGTSTLTVTNGSIGTLSGTGTSLTVNEGGTLAIANTTASLTSLTLNGTLKLGKGSGDTANQLTLGGLTLGEGATLAIDETGLAVVTEGVDRTALIVFSGDAPVTSLASPLKLDITGWDLELDEAQDEYRYALFENFEPGESWKQYLSIIHDDLAKGWEIDYDYETGDLVFTHMSYDDEWVWDGSGNGGGIWSDGDDNNWTQDGTPSDKNVYFTEEGAQANGGLVTIDGDGVTPNAIYVHGGSYTFESATEDGAGLDVEEGIVIGGLGYEAELELKLANTSVPKVTLKEKGTLTVSHEDALQTEGDDATPATEIVFEDGGTLAYGKTADGGYVEADLSALVSKESTGIIRIRVGETELAAAALDDPAPVVWGNASATTADNEGISRALTVGLEKTGTDALVVEWSAQDGETYGAKTEALEGTLTFKMHAGKDVTATLERTVTLAGGATAEYTAVGGGTMVIADGYEGVDGEVGKVVIGAAAADTAGYVLSGDLSGFGGTLELRGDSEGASVSVASAAALGGEDTDLVLNGRAINLAAGGAVSAASIEVTDGTVNKLSGDAVITLTTGSLTGGGVLTTDGQHGIAATEISGFTGTLVAGVAAAEWTLTGSDATTIGATLAGNGTITFNYTGDVALIGAVGDDTYGAGTSLQNAGEGELVIRISEENAKSSGALITSATAGDIRLGNEDGAGYWNGATLSGDGNFVLSNGALLTAITAKGGAKLNVETLVNGTVDAGGTKGSMLNSIYLEANSKLTGVTGDITVGDGSSSLWLRFGEDNVGATAGGDGYMIGATGNVIINDLGDKEAPSFVLDFSADGVMEVLKTLIEAESAYLHVTNGKLELDEALWSSIQGTDGGALRLLRILGVQVDGVENGDIRLTGAVNDVYFVLDENDPNSMEHEVNGYGELDKYKATVVDKGQTLTLTLTGAVDAADSNATEHEKELGGGVINNLVGVEGSTLRLENGDTDQGRVTVVLNNETEYPDLLPEEARGIDTEFLGSIEGGEGVDVRKTGAGTLTVGSSRTGKGGLSIEGDLALSGGALHVAGNNGGRGNELGSLTFDYAGEAEDGEERGITFSGGVTTVHGINDTNGQDADIHLTRRGELRVDSSDSLANATIDGDGSGTLTVVAGDDPDYTGLIIDSTNSADTERLKDVNLHVTEGGSLTLTGGTLMTGGNTTVGGAGADSTLTLTEGAGIIGGDVLVAAGGTVEAASGASIVAEDMLVDDGAAVSVSEGAALTTNGHLYVLEEGELEVTDGTLTASRSLSLEGKLSLNGDTTADVSGLHGSGTLSGTGGAELNLHGRGNRFTGTLSGTGTIHVTEPAVLLLKGVTQDGGNGRWNVVNDGKLTIDVSGNSSDAPTRLGDVILGNNSQTTLVINTDTAKTPALDIDSLSWGRNVSLTVSSTGFMPVAGNNIRLANYSGVGLDGKASNMTITLDGVAFMHFDPGKLYVKSGHLMLGVQEVAENRLARGVAESNPMAGADLFWNASSPRSAYWRLLTVNPQLAATSDLYRMTDGLYKLSRSGNTTALKQALAAGAGAGTSVLGMSLSHDVERQLISIRNRTTTMAAEPTYTGYDALPSYHMWMNGEGSYHKMNSDGYAPGFTLNSWGGTVGVDTDVDEGTTVGLALTAMYGDLRADSADRAHGEQDTTYLSAFARVASGSWLHTIVLTGGLTDVSLNRTVSCGGFSYNTTGNSSGYVLGALYELGYASVVNDAGTLVIQSVFNVAYRHVSLNSYNETGSDAGLSVADISYNTVTFGMGARMQAVVGENSVNRTGIFEARALVKVDTGDHAGVASNALMRGDGTRRQLKSAEVGAMGLEVGAGVSIPLGENSGSIFMDASLELRRGYTTVDGNVGYRFSF